MTCRRNAGVVTLDWTLWSCVDPGFWNIATIALMFFESVIMTASVVVRMKNVGELKRWTTKIAD